MSVWFLMPNIRKLESKGDVKGLLEIYNTPKNKPQIVTDSGDALARMVRFLPTLQSRETLLKNLRSKERTKALHLLFEASKVQRGSAIHLLSAKEVEATILLLEPEIVVSQLVARLQAWGSGADLAYMEYEVIPRILVHFGEHTVSYVLANCDQANMKTDRFVSILKRIPDKRLTDFFMWLLQERPAMDSVNMGWTIEGLTTICCSQAFDEVIFVYENAHKADWFTTNELPKLVENYLYSVGTLCYDRLLALREQKDKKTYPLIIKVLAKLGQKEATMVMYDRLSSESPRVRLDALDALIVAGVEDLDDILAVSATDKDFEVVKLALATLKNRDIDKANKLIAELCSKGHLFTKATKIDDKKCERTCIRCGHVDLGNHEFKEYSTPIDGYYHHYELCSRCGCTGRYDRPW